MTFQTCNELQPESPFDSDTLPSLAITICKTWAAKRSGQHGPWSDVVREYGRQRSRDAATEKDFDDTHTASKIPANLDSMTEQRKSQTLRLDEVVLSASEIRTPECPLPRRDLMKQLQGDTSEARRRQKSLETIDQVVAGEQQPYPFADRL